MSRSKLFPVAYLIMLAVTVFAGWYMDASGTLFPLTAGVIVPHMGCKTMSYGFFVPDLPPGKYTLRSTINYPNGLMNDEQSITLPATSLEIVP